MSSTTLSRPAVAMAVSREWERLPRNSRVVRATGGKKRLRFGPRRTVAAPSAEEAQQPDEWHQGLAREVSETWDA